MIRIIAEAGCNWRDLDEAKEFIRKSKDLNLFATKFQLYNEEIIKDNPNFDFLKSIMLDFEQAKELYDYGQGMGQEVFFTPMFPKAIDWILEIGCEYIKIRYKDQWNSKIILKALKTKLPLIVSTEIPYRSNQINSLLCVPKYPASELDYIEKIGKNFWEMWNGISDHTPELDLFEDFKLNCYKGFPIYYFEKHMKLEGTTPLENDWSVSFKELKEVL